MPEYYLPPSSPHRNKLDLRRLPNIEKIREDYQYEADKNGNVRRIGPLPAPRNPDLILFVSQAKERDSEGKPLYNVQYADNKNNKIRHLDHNEVLTKTGLDFSNFSPGSHDESFDLFEGLTEAQVQTVHQHNTEVAIAIARGNKPYHGLKIIRKNSNQTMNTIIGWGTYDINYN